MAAESIAIIGLGCRFPGASGPESYWQLLRNGIDAIAEVPPDRWDVDSFYGDVPATPGKMNTRWGGFLEKIDEFDASFFGIAPREAERIDPQQRLLMEVAWEALENAGLIPGQLSGSQTGVFIGISNSDYGKMLTQDIESINAYNGTGTAFCIAANRISYFLNLKGPSLAIDTACSSSLIAVHYACQSLRSGESDLCLAGGVNAILSPEVTINFSQARMMAADGRCKTFDNRADGYVRGEGCGVVILKRLSDAIRDGDNIRAIIRGTAVNQDGLTNGITAPNGPSQQAVIRQALKNAEITPSEISYVEAHGTGTPLGDPQEFSSLKAVLLRGRQPDQSCWIGSVKTNIGHLESAAGIAGLIKVVLSLQHQKIPPHLHLQQLNRYISLEGIPLAIPTECQPWEITTEKRLAGVSSFGFGGTNCHVILEEAPVRSEGAESGKNHERPLNLLALSAKTEPALVELAGRYRAFLASHPDLSVADVCFAANTGRSQFECRLAVVADSSEQLQERLENFALGREEVGLVSGKASSRKSPEVSFLFTGQGSQYVDMGRQLYETQPTFRASLDRCADILDSYLDEPLLAILYSEVESASPKSKIQNPKLNKTAYTQPALFALEYSIYELWNSWGIKPSAVMGHSVGEYVAACVAGVFSLEDGLKLIAHRGRLMQALPQDGQMVAVFAAEAQVKEAIQDYREKVAIAAINGLQSIVISGQKEAIEAVKIKLESQEIQTKPLVVSHAFHSPLMEPMSGEFEQVAQTVNYSSPQIPIVSNLTGELAGSDIATPEYWCRHILQPVRFADSMEALNEQGYGIFLEVGPKPILVGMARLILEETPNPKSNPPLTPPKGEIQNPKSYLLLPSLRQGVEDWQQMLQSLGELYVKGVSVDWSGFDRDYVRRSLPLPTYPFQRQRYWFKSADSGFLQVSSTDSNGKSRLNQKTSSSDRVLPKQEKALNRGQILILKPEERLQHLKSYFSQVLAKITGISPTELDWQQQVSNLGIDSLMATELRKRIEMDLEVMVPVEYFAGLNLEQFFQQVVLLVGGNSPSNNLSPVDSTPSGEESKTQGNLWFIRPNLNPQTRFRLFCFPYAGAGASIFHSWSQELPSEIELCSIQLPGRENRLTESPFIRLKSLIQTLTPLISPYLDLPFAFFGHSLGALLSFELARELRRQNLPCPGHLFVSSRPAPQIPDLERPIHSLPEPKFIEALGRLKGTPKEVLQDSELMQLYLPALRADFAMLETYFYVREAPLDCPISAFGGLEDDKVNRGALEAWQEQTSSGFSLKILAGDHLFLHLSQKELLSAMVEKISKNLMYEIA